MARTLLLDTGFLVALANGRDPDHERCVEAWASLRGRIVTVEGVLVEAAHLLRRGAGLTERAFRIALSVGTLLQPLSADRLERALALMKRYRNVPMDLVDALLVVAAEELGTSEVLTLDRRGFETYRLSGGGRFDLIPDHRTAR